MAQADTHAANRTRLKNLIDDQSDTLLRTLCIYIARAGLAQGESATRMAAHELLNDLVVEALAHADRFDPARQPIPWLLGIAANLVRRRQAELARNHRREPLARDLAGENSQSLGDDEIFDRVAALSADPGEPLEARQRLENLLKPLSMDERQVVQLAILHEMDGASLARELGIRPGAARVRLHRALGKLRRAAIGLEVSNG